MSPTALATLEAASCAPDVRDFGRGAGSGDIPDNSEPEEESVPNWRLQSSNTNLLCSRLPLRTFHDDSEQRSFQEVTVPPAANHSRRCGLYGPDNSFNSETAFGILDEQDRDQGPLPDFGFLGASCNLQDILVAVPAAAPTSEQRCRGEPA